MLGLGILERNVEFIMLSYVLYNKPFNLSPIRLELKASHSSRGYGFFLMIKQLLKDFRYINSPIMLHTVGLIETPLNFSSVYTHIHWMPGHQNVGNEKADEAAKYGVE